MILPRDATDAARIRFMQTMIFECVEKVLIVAHGTRAPLDEEWEAWMARMGRLDYDCVLILTDGAAPTPKQRSATNAFWEGKEKPKMAVLSESALVRGAIFAFYYLFKGGMRPFAPAHMNDALAFMDVPNTAWEAVARTALRLHGAIRATEVRETQAVA